MKNVLIYSAYEIDIMVPFALFLLSTNNTLKKAKYQERLQTVTIGTIPGNIQG